MFSVEYFFLNACCYFKDFMIDTYLPSLITLNSHTRQTKAQYFLSLHTEINIEHNNACQPKLPVVKIQ